MIKLENTILPSADQWKAIIFGARNPLNSWARSDSKFVEEADFDPEDYPCGFELGDNDYSLMQRLAKAGTDHRKFMRMITVYIDITAPLYWWKEFDTYKIGTVANSCSTMHKIAEKEFTLEDFSHEHLLSRVNDEWKLPGNPPYGVLRITVNTLNKCRDAYLKTKDKTYWWQMIQLLPSSYNQKRTVMLNYEVLANMYKSRKNHKLDEWHDLCAWIESLPCSELITGEAKTE
jgi:hypothetical protein